MGFEFIFIIFALAVPVLIVIGLVRVVMSFSHPNQNKHPNQITPHQLKQAAAGTAILVLVPSFLYQLADSILSLTQSITASPSIVSDTSSNSSSSTSIIVIIGAVAAILIAIGIHQNKTAAYGLGAGGVLTLIVEFLNNFEAISPVVRIGVIGLMLATLIGVAVKKTMEHEKTSVTPPDIPKPDSSKNEGEHHG